MAEATIYRKIFRDICRGYSEINFQNSPVYVKHISTQEQVDLDEVYQNELDRLIKKGLPSNKDRLDTIIKEGLWSNEDEIWISSQKDYILRMEESKKNIILKSQIDKQALQIKNAEQKLNEKLLEKENLLGQTCEKFADKRLNDFYILLTIFKDKELKYPYFETEDDFFELSEDDEDGGYHELVKEYNYFIKLCSEKNIQSVVLQDFYYSYFPFCEDTIGFFGIPVAKLTHYQLKLIIYTRVFKNILESGHHIPEKIKKDPTALLEFGSMSPESRERIEKKIKGDGTTSLVGATKEDYEYLGLTPPSESGVSLSDKLKEFGGNMSMQDLMKASGIKTK